MPSPEEEQCVINYFTRLHTALFEYVHPHRHSIGTAFSRIATEPKTLQLAFCKQGIFVRLLNEWLGEATIIRRDIQYESATIFHMTRLTTDPSNISFRTALRLPKDLGSADMFGYDDSFGVEHLYPTYISGAQIMKMFGVVKSTAILHAFPIWMTDATRLQNERSEIGSREMLEAASRDFAPNFLFQWATNRDDMLEGLDSDPAVEAHALMEIILEQCGVISEPPGRRYSRAHSALKLALQRENSSNETAIHSVISQFRWILIDETDIADFHSEKSIQYQELTNRELGGQISSTTHRFRPDFIYKLHGGDYVIVEIEAASKNLMINTKETGFQLFSAAANHALAQIRNYKSIITGYGSNDVCMALNCPSTTNYRFLLVVGSNEQLAFDQRSWDHQVRQLAGEGIELRSWYYYLERLERRRVAAYDSNSFKP